MTHTENFFNIQIDARELSKDISQFQRNMNCHVHVFGNSEYTEKRFPHLCKKTRRKTYCAAIGYETTTHSLLVVKIHNTSF